MRNVSLIEYDMEAHYKDSLSTAVVNILLQCGFENCSRRALDELIGMAINYVRNMTVKIANLTSDCNLRESDILIGLGALKMHGHNLDELFEFVENYNEIFPPPPKTYFGPIPLGIDHRNAVRVRDDGGGGGEREAAATARERSREEKPMEIVAWAPDMTASLATIGMRLKNGQIVSDPNFDRSNYPVLSFNSPPSQNHSDYKWNNQLNGGVNNNSNSSNSSIINSTNSGNNIITNSKIPKYGSNCSYRLPPEAYPNKYEPPTIDLDSSGAVITLNGKLGKLPDPFISDNEEQDLLRPRVPLSSAAQSMSLSKMSFIKHQQSLFNGVRSINNTSNSTNNSSIINSSNSATNIGLTSSSVINNNTTNISNSVATNMGNYSISNSIINSTNSTTSLSKKKLSKKMSEEYGNQKRSIHEDPLRISPDNNNGTCVTQGHSNNSSLGRADSPVIQSQLQSQQQIYQQGSLSSSSSSSNHHHNLHSTIMVSKTITGAGAVSSSVSSSSKTDRNVTSDDVWNAALKATVEPLTISVSAGLSRGTTGVSSVTSITPSVGHDIGDTNAGSCLTGSKRHQHQSSKKQKRNASFSGNTRPKKVRKVEMEIKADEIASQDYQNESTMDSYVSERSVPYSSPSDREPLYNNYDTYRSNNIPEKSPSYSPANNNYVPTHSINYHTEILPPLTLPSTTKSNKSKKKSSRKTHFTNKRKKKPLYSSAVSNNIYSINHQLENHSVEMDVNDNLSIIHYRSNTPSPHPILDNYFEDSDDDRTEPMQESSEELLRMLELPDPTEPKPSSNSVNVIDPPPPTPLHQVLNNNQSLHMNNVIDDVPGQGGIRMKIKIRKNKNSFTRGPSSIVNSNTDLSSPIQSQHSDDKNSISERLQLMHYHSPMSDIDERIYHQHSSYDKSSNQSHYDIHQNSPAYSSTQESFSDFYRHDNSIASGAVSSTFSKPSTPNKHTIKSSNVNITRFNSSSTHSSLKTLPALDDCDKIPTLLFKNSKSGKKRKRSRLSSGSKKVKSKKSVKLKLNHEDTVHIKPVEKLLVSVDDIFSDEDETNKIDQNHYTNKSAIPHTPHQVIPPRPIITQPSPVILDTKSPQYRLPIPSFKVNSKSSSVKKSSKSSKSSSKSSLMNTTTLKSSVEPKPVYSYCCLQGEANYKSEDGKTVYTCPICNTEDNGSLMLGCDRCLDWYHGLCLGIFIPPPIDQDWFCPRCQEDKLFESQHVTPGATSKSKSSKARSKKK